VGVTSRLSNVLPGLLVVEDERIVTRHEVPMSIAQPEGFRPVGQVTREAAFLGHPFAITLAAYLGMEAFVLCTPSVSSTVRVLPTTPSSRRTESTASSFAAGRCARR
jgi:hypothetical protein